MLLPICSKESQAPRSGLRHLGSCTASNGAHGCKPPQHLNTSAEGSEARQGISLPAQRRHYRLNSRKRRLLRIGWTQSSPVQRPIEHRHQRRCPQAEEIHANIKPNGTGHPGRLPGRLPGSPSATPPSTSWMLQNEQLCWAPKFGHIDLQLELAYLSLGFALALSLSWPPNEHRASKDYCNCRISQSPLTVVGRSMEEHACNSRTGHTERDTSSISSIIRCRLTVRYADRHQSISKTQTV